MEIAKNYTNVLYASKDEVRISFGNAGLEKVWLQIQEYRNQFKIECQLMNIKRYFVLTPQIFQRILEKQSELISIYSLISFKEYERHLFKILLKYNMPLHYHSFIKLHPLIQIFLVQDNLKGMIKEEITSLICEVYGYQNYISLFLESNGCISESMNLDSTRPFLDWLEYICSKIQEKVLHFNQINELDVKQLMRLNPDICYNQCHFYANHHSYGNYYSVEEYIQFCGTSYETARQHLLKMVDVGWYRKIKAGKKYVYTIIA